MAHHQHIGTHGHIGAGRVQQAFPLAEGTAGGGKALHIGGEAPGGQFETAAGAGAGFKEKGGYQTALEGRQTPGPGGGQGMETAGQLQHGGVVVAAEGRQIKHMAVGPATQDNAAQTPSR